VVACQHHVGRQVKVLWTRGRCQGRAGLGEGGASGPVARLVVRTRPSAAERLESTSTTGRSRQVLSG